MHLIGEIRLYIKPMRGETDLHCVILSTRNFYLAVNNYSSSFYHNMSASKLILINLLYVFVAYTLISTAPTSDKASSTTQTRPDVDAELTIEFNGTSKQSEAFSCHGRQLGYYADIEHNCKVYHFCIQGDFDGELVSQRVTYLCLNETVFDQQKLDCIEPIYLSAPCEKSSDYFEVSNLMLKEVLDSKAAVNQTN